MATLEKVESDQHAEIADLVTELAEYRTMLFDPATSQTTKDLVLQTITARTTDLTVLHKWSIDLEARNEARNEARIEVPTADAGPIFFYHSLRLYGAKGNLASLAKVRGRRKYIQAKANEIGVVGAAWHYHYEDAI